MATKPTVNFPSGGKVVLTEEGRVQSFTAPASSIEKQPLFQKFSNAILTAGALSALMVGFVFWAGHYKATIDYEIKALRADVDKLKGVNGNAEIRGLIGTISGKSASKRKSSYGVDYDLSCNICEFNESYQHWKEIPRLGQFIEIRSLDSGLRAICMNIGSFSDHVNINRILIVSRPVANNLDFGGGIISAKIRLLPESEVRTKKDCLELRKKYKINLANN